ncbi:hypothetical protein NL676_032403 [Syzygium grande]|nr:hypothetical protein NL676_032403 [Syzygium grande]
MNLVASQRDRPQIRSQCRTTVEDATERSYDANERERERERRDGLASEVRERVGNREVISSDGKNRCTAERTGAVFAALGFWLVRDFVCPCVYGWTLGGWCGISSGTVEGTGGLGSPAQVTSHGEAFS